MSEPLLEVRGLGVDYRGFRALGEVSFEISPGETLGLVGESGSGKSTLARALLRLIPAARGEVLWRGSDLLRCDSRTLRRHRRDLQIVFQDPVASLNPRMTVAQALAEPLRIFEPDLGADERRLRMAGMLGRIGLAAPMLDRYPHELSGGQCQRVGIARAMMLDPKLLICDEPVSALDVSIQGQIVNLLLDLQAEKGTAMLFISHDLAVVRHVSHRVLVLYAGRILESAACDALFASAVHPYTRALLAAVPDPLRAASLRAAGGRGHDTASAAAPVAAPALIAGSVGCAFRGRCAHARLQCSIETPRLEEVASGHLVACHLGRELVYS